MFPSLLAVTHCSPCKACYLTCYLTPIHRNVKQREDTASTKQDIAPHAKTNANSTVPSFKETSKTSTTNHAKKAPTAPQKNDDKPVPKPRTEKTPETKTGLTTTDLKATNNDDKSMEQQPSTSKSTEQPAPVKRKLATSSLQINHRKTEDTKTPNKAQTTDITDTSKDSKLIEANILINGKACVQRNLDFSAGQYKTKIPVTNKARVGRSPGNRGPNAETRLRSRSRSRHREPGPPEGRGQNTH